MLLFRNAKTGEIVVGSEDRVEQCHYAAVITRVEEELDNELTGGWKIIEVSDHGFLCCGYIGAHTPHRWVGDPLASTCSPSRLPHIVHSHPAAQKLLAIATYHTNRHALHDLGSIYVALTPPPPHRSRSYTYISK